MKAESCYQSSEKGAVPLMIVSKSQYQTLLTTLNEKDSHALKSQQFQANLGEVGVLLDARGEMKRAMIGGGNGNEAQAIAHAVSRLPQHRYLPELPLSQRALLVWSLAQYRFDRYQSLEGVSRQLVVAKEALIPIVAEAEAVYLVRDLINTPPNDMTPLNLAEILASLADKHGAEFKQWVGDELLQDNFPAIHAVGRASIHAPRLLSLTWGDRKHPLVTLIGKGVCFDSGGLNIKTGDGMRLMKKDMGGAAQVLGLAQWLMTVGLPIRLHILIPAVENSVGSNSYRPGDILTMRNGLRVEIDNTDGEGRLILADALVKACEDNPELLIDFATLTGAARVAVGTEIAAMFSNQDDIAGLLSDMGHEITDPIWRMPLFEAYDSLLDSSIADLTNCSSSSYGGAITAALFLKRFIKEIPWVHFDIMAWNLKNKPGKPEGGEAMGMQSVGHYLFRRYGYSPQGVGV